MASLRREVLGGYRRLMRVRQIAFKDDAAVLEAAKSQLRIEFTKNKDVTDPSKIAGLIKGINEVEDMLRYNIAQAKINERGNYAVNVAPKTPGTGPGKDGKLEVEHIGSKAGNLPADVTVTTQSSAGGAPPPPPPATAGGKAGEGGARHR